MLLLPLVQSDYSYHRRKRAVVREQRTLNMLLNQLWRLGRARPARRQPGVATGGSTSLGHCCDMAQPVRCGRSWRALQSLTEPRFGANVPTTFPPMECENDRADELLRVAGSRVASILPCSP